MRVVFAGCPAIAVPSLITISEIKEIKLAGVLTNPDSAKGRHGTLIPTEVGEAAERLNIPILKPVKLDADVREQVAALKPDLLVSFAYSRIFGPKFLALFPLGGINIHPSLLPKYRGPSPIQAAILNNDTVTGISIQTIALEMDCGDILAAEQLQLTGRETQSSLNDTVAQKAKNILAEVLKKIISGMANSEQLTGKQQNHSEASYCRLITKDDGIINWNESAVKIDAKIRALSPWPLCRTVHNERELLILKAAVYNGNTNDEQKKQAGLVLGTDKQYGILIQTGEGILAVTELQYQAKKALFWRDFLNGARDFTGSYLEAFN